VAVEEAGAHWQKIDRGRLKLVELQDELNHLRLEYEVPSEVLDALVPLMGRLLGLNLPRDTHLEIRVPSSLDLTLDLAGAGGEATF
jgi:hypothetical protein